LVGLFSWADGGHIEFYEDVGNKVIELQALDLGGGDFGFWE
jgi:hypothetical protein